MQLVLQTRPEFLDKQFLFLKNCLLGQCSSKFNSDPTHDLENVYLYPRPMPLLRQAAQQLRPDHKPSSNNEKSSFTENKELKLIGSNFEHNPVNSEHNPVDSEHTPADSEYSSAEFEQNRKKLIANRIPFHSRELEEMGIFDSDFASVGSDAVSAGKETKRFEQPSRRMVKVDKKQIYIANKLSDEKSVSLIASTTKDSTNSTAAQNLLTANWPQPINWSKLRSIKDRLSNISKVKTASKDKPEAKTLGAVKPSFFTNAANWALGLLMLAAVSVLVVYFGPQLYYSVLSPQTNQRDHQSTVNLEQQEEVSPLLSLLQAEQERVKELSEDTAAEPKGRYLPETNATLPEGDLIIVPRIGVNTTLQRTETAEEALETGVWWVPDFGLPGDLDKPMIVAGHRFGWQWWWKTDYWKYHSFYKLTELEPGDRIEIISEQRRWIYEVYATEESEEITDYHADLILYTCKHLNSPIRYFKYASLVRDDV